MRTCLVGAPAEPGDGLNQLAENLLMFDTVGIRAIDGEKAADSLVQIPVQVLEELMESGALVLAIRASYPVVFQGGNRLGRGQDLPEPLVRFEEFRGYRIGTMTTTPGVRPFAEAFEDKAKKTLPLRLREIILSRARVIELDDNALMSISKSDMENPKLREKALYTVRKAGYQPPPDIPAPHLFDDMMATLNVMNANWCLGETSLGFSVVAEDWTQPLVRTKLESVFQPTTAEVSEQAFRELLDINQLPSVAEMFRMGALDWYQVARIRKAEGKAFRDWFQDVANRPASETKEFLRDYTAILTTASRKTPVFRRTSLFLLEQAVGWLGTALGFGAVPGIAASALNSLVVPALSRPKPYIMFEFLRERRNKVHKK